MGLQLQTPSDLADFYMAINIICYILAAGAVVVNGGIFTSYVIQRIRKPAQFPLTASGVLVLNLLVADCACGINNICIGKFKMWPENAKEMAKYEWLCPIRFVGGFLTFIGSFFALINVVLDRYVAVLHTLKYRDWMTVRTSVKMVILGWMIPVAGAIYIETGNEWKPGVKTCTENTIIPWFLSHVWVPITFLSFLCIVIIQAVVTFELHRRSRNKAAMSNVTKIGSQKAARVLLQSTTIFILSWGGFDTCQLIYVFYPDKWIKFAYDISFIFALMSFLSNPLLFSIKTKSVRGPVSSLFHDIVSWCGCSKKSSSPEISRNNNNNNKSSQSCSSTTAGSGKRESISSTTEVTDVSSSVDYNVV